MGQEIYYNRNVTDSDKKKLSKIYSFPCNKDNLSAKIDNYYIMKIKSITLNLIFLLSIVSIGWAEKSSEAGSGLEKLFPGSLLDSNGKKVSNSVLSGKTVGIYFSAHWCPPCRSFTPNLVKFRDKNKKNFEVVFVSSDRDENAQMKYMKEADMKWYTLAHRSDAANALKKKFEIRGIPSLVIVSEDGKTITKNGRGDVSSNPKGALKSWQNKS